MIYAIGLYIVVNFYKIVSGVGRDLSLLVIKYYRIIVWKFFKWKTKRNQVINEEVIRDYMTDDEWRRRGKKRLIRVKPIFQDKIPDIVIKAGINP